MKIKLICEECGKVISEYNNAKVKTINTALGERGVILLDSGLNDDSLYQDTHDPRESFIVCDSCKSKFWVEDCLDTDEIVRVD